MKFDKRLLAQLQNVRAFFALTILCGLGIGILTIAQARALSQLIAQVFLHHAPRDAVWNVMLVLLAIIFARAVLSWASEVSAFQIAARIKTDLRERVFKRLLELGPAYVRGERTGELSNTLTEGIESLDAYLSQYLPQLVLAALVPLAVLAFIFPLDLLSGFVLLFTGPLIPIFMILIGSAAEALTRKQYSQLSLMSAHFLDVLQGLTTLKIFGRSCEQIETIARVSQQYRDTTLSVLRVAFLSAFALEMIATISTAIVAVQVGLRLLYGQLDFERAFFVLVLAPDFYLPLRLLGTRFHAGMSGVAAAARIFEILELKDDRQRTTEKFSIHPPSSVSRIDFNEVHYSYDGTRAALNGVSFSIEPGQRVALVGATGAGKSTVVNLLLRFIESTRGEILCGAVSLRAWSPDDWRKQIAWVPQMPYLFNESIANNIRLARPDATMEDVMRAAQLAHADEFIRALPHAYDTMIGERGARLSGGQAQRVALARAFLKDAPVLILDEPTSNLDVETEELLQDSLERLLKDKTALIVSHRLNTAMRADQIIVLDAGRVAEIGNHQTLLDKRGAYFQLTNSNSQTPNPNSPISNLQPFGAAQDKSPSSNLRFPTSTPDASCITQHVSRNTFYSLLRLAAPFKWWIALAVLLGAFTIGSSIGLMATSAFIIASAALHPSVADLAVPIVGVRFFGIARGVFRYLERYVSHYINFSLLARLRVWFYTAIEPLAPARLTQYRSGDLLARIVGDIETLQNFYVRIIAPPMIALVVAVAMFVFFAGFAIELALVVLAFMFLVGVVTPIIVQRISVNANRQLIEMRAAMNSHLVDSIQGIVDLIAYGREQTQINCVGELNRRLIGVQTQLASIAGWHNAAGNFFAHLAMWCVLLLAIPLVNAARFDGVYLAVLALATLSSFEGVLALPLAFQYLESNLQAARRLFNIADEGPTTKDERSSQFSVLRPSSSVAFQNVSFYYAPGEPLALVDVSFELRAGKRLAIVGESGAGKSTIVNLLMRFWDYERGKILIDGCELRDYSPEDTRRFFAIVARPTHLFNASIRDNLLLARPAATEAAMIDAATRAQIHDLIATLPKKYDTRIGEQGLRLSGGERQRLAIARALLKNAPILIFDEPAANLDPITERQVLRAIQQSTTNRTTLMITHRLAGLTDFDEIIVMRAGRIVERGTHDELLRCDGWYRRMWQLEQRIIASA
jgi:ATP-binding cassette subfamily C protein CydCD